MGRKVLDPEVLRRITRSRSRLRGGNEQIFAFKGETKSSACHARRRRISRKEWLRRFLAFPRETAVEQAQRPEQRAMFERHDEVVYQFRLPCPPSFNEAWFRSRGMFVLSASGRAYHDAVNAVWSERWHGHPPQPLTGRLRLLVVFVFPTRAGDVNNRVKLLEDAMQSAGIFVNDRQIDESRHLRGTPCQPGWCDVTIERIETEGT